MELLKKMFNLKADLVFSFYIKDKQDIHIHLSTIRLNVQANYS